MSRPITALDIASILTEMAKAVAKRDNHPNAGYAHYSLKFALIAGSETALEIAQRDITP